MPLPEEMRSIDICFVKARIEPIDCFKIIRLRGISSASFISFNLTINKQYEKATRFFFHAYFLCECP